MNSSHRSGEKKTKKKKRREARESDPLLPPSQPPDLCIRPSHSSALRSRRSPPLTVHPNIDHFSGMSTTDEHNDRTDHDIDASSNTHEEEDGTQGSSHRSLLAAALSEHPTAMPLEPSEVPVVLLDGPVLTDQSSYDAPAPPLPQNYQSMDPILRNTDEEEGSKAPFFVPPVESATSSSHLEPRHPVPLSKSSSYPTRTTQNDEPPLLEIPEEIYAVRKAALQVLKPLNKTWVRT